MPDTASRQASPYPGTRSFAVGERGRFFGREKETRDLTDLVLGCPLVVLSAQSGAGKTSLIQAGLGPRAAGEDAVVVLGRVSGRVAAAELPGIANIFAHNCLQSLRHADEDATCLAPSEPPATLLAGLIAAARAGGLHAEADGAATFFGRPLIVVIDQFEEIFTTHQERWPDRRPFFEQLAAALTALPDLRVLLALRDDHVGELDPYADSLPGGLRTRYRLERLRREQAVNAIEKPLALPDYGYELRTAIARGIVHELLLTNVVRTPGAPDTGPVEGEFVEAVQLQVVCANLWDAIQRAKPVAPAEAARLAADAALAKSESELVFTRGEAWYRAASAAVRDIQGALRAIYDRAVVAAAWQLGTKDAEGRLRALVAEDLITVGGTRGFVDVATAAAKGIPVAALDELEAERILRREPRAGAAWYELTHDRFIEPVRASNTAWTEARRSRLPRRLVSAAGFGLLLVAAVIGVDSYTVRRTAKQAEQAAGEARKKAEQATLELKLAQTRELLAKQKAQQESIAAKQATSDAQWTQDEAALLAQAVANAHSVADLNLLKSAVKDETLSASNGPDNPARQKARNQWYQGYAAFRAGKESTAVHFYKQALAADPSYAPAYHSLAVIDHNAHHLDQAAAGYEKTIELDPSYVLAYANYANLEVMRNAPEKAEKLAAKALEIRPNYPPARRALAKAQSHRDTEAAEF